MTPPTTKNDSPKSRGSNESAFIATRSFGASLASADVEPDMLLKATLLCPELNTSPAGLLQRARTDSWGTPVPDAGTGAEGTRGRGQQRGGH
jgi:hypothetical protein